MKHISKPLNKIVGKSNVSIEKGSDVGIGSTAKATSVTIPKRMAASTAKKVPQSLVDLGPDSGDENVVTKWSDINAFFSAVESIEVLVVGTSESKLQKPKIVSASNGTVVLHGITKDPAAKPWGVFNVLVKSPTKRHVDRHWRISDSSDVTVHVSTSPSRLTDSKPATEVKRVISKAVSSQERAREYLVRLGTLTQAGNVTRKYGGK